MDSYIYLSTLSLNDWIKVTVVQKNNQLFVAKTALNSGGEELILREVFILRLLQGIPGVPYLSEVFLKPQVTSIQSFYTLGDLEMNFSRLSLELKIKIGLALITSLEKVHQRNVIHNDIKPSNVVLDESLNPVICDWTFGDLLQNQAFLYSKSFMGTPLFLAPEAFLGRHSQKSDIYSLAATLFWLFNNTLPFSASNLKDLYREKITLNISDTTSGSTKYLNNVLLQCLAPNPEKRPDLEILRQTLQFYTQKLAA
jgi:serine/threonine protein kinase